MNRWGIGETRRPVHQPAVSFRLMPRPTPLRAGACVADVARLTKMRSTRRRQPTRPEPETRLNSNHVAAAVKPDADRSVHPYEIPEDIVETKIVILASAGTTPFTMIRLGGFRP